MSNPFSPERQMKRISRRSFTWALLAVFGGYGALRWINGRTEEGGVPWPLRTGLDATDNFTGELVQRHSPVVDASKITKNPRVNDDTDASTATRADFKLTLTGASDEDIEIPMADLLAMPMKRMTTEFHCIEGWTQVVQWGGVPLADFLKKHPPVDGQGKAIPADSEDYPQYLSMATESGDYYVGLDSASALHPQTLLCYEMNGQELSKEHGGPLRLVIPVKYGVKNIKWLGTIAYSATKPDDYWAERGYDWFAGL